MIGSAVVVAFCGWSGSGKTTLIERLIPILREDGLAVAAIKHDAHGIDVDRPGKDSDRFFRAGADLWLHGPDELLFRGHCDDPQQWQRVVTPLADQYDVIILEGHKATAMPKVWLLAEGEDSPPDDVEHVLAVLGRGEDRLAAALEIVRGQLQQQYDRTPLWGCVLIGGQSRRMGTAKHLLVADGKTWLAHAVERLDHVCDSVVIVGAGALPDALAERTQLADAPTAKGPLAGILSAMRWAPHVSWLVAACDQPDLTVESLRWLLSCRCPGVWTIQGRLPSQQESEPFPGWYDFRCRHVLEQLTHDGELRVRSIGRHPKAMVRDVPEALVSTWRNVNTPCPE